MNKIKHFDSDYMEGCLPEVMQRLVDTNLEQTPGYGLDRYCDEAKSLIYSALINKEEKLCSVPQELDIHFLVGGTQTNATVIDALLDRHEGVLCADSAHINVHESGAIEASGHKVLALPTRSGKVDAGELEKYLTSFYEDETFEHMVAPGMLYISYPTEYGTLYTSSELEDLHGVCQRADIPMYIDGARLGYGLMSPECDIVLQDVPNLCDIFYIGGTKVGLLFGECVVARMGLLKHFFPLVKQHGALLAKGRLLGVQFGALFTPDRESGEILYFKAARHAIDMAMMLKRGFVDKGYRMYLDSPTNQQFFVLPNGVIDRLAKTSTFEIWGTRGKKESVARFVTSWATREEDVKELIGEL